MIVNWIRLYQTRFRQGCFILWALWYPKNYEMQRLLKFSEENIKFSIFNFDSQQNMNIWLTKKQWQSRLDHQGYLSTHHPQRPKDTSQHKPSPLTKMIVHNSSRQRKLHRYRSNRQSLFQLNLNFPLKMSSFPPAR